VPSPIGLLHLNSELNTKCHSTVESKVVSTDNKNNLKMSLSFKNGLHLDSLATDLTSTHFEWSGNCRAAVVERGGKGQKRKRE